ncbi:MAG: hypothetical protein WBD86_03700 [Microgenomates group bacterium]
MRKLAIDIGETFFGPESNSNLRELEGIGSLVSSIISIAIAVAGIILLFFFVFGGISMIAGAGRDNPEQAAKGKQAVTSALIGFVIVFAAYWIVQLIEILTGINILG